MRRIFLGLAPKGPYLLVGLMLIAGMVYFVRTEFESRQRIIDLASANALFTARNLADRVGLHLESADMVLLDAKDEAEAGHELKDIPVVVHRLAQASSAIRCVLAARLHVPQVFAQAGRCQDGLPAELASLAARHERLGLMHLVSRSSFRDGATGALVSRVVESPSGPMLMVAQVEFFPPNATSRGLRLEYPGQIVLYDEQASPMFAVDANQPGVPLQPDSMENLSLFSELTSAQMLGESFNVLITERSIVAASKAPGTSLRIGVALDFEMVLSQWRLRFVQRLVVRLAVYAVIISLGLLLARRGQAVLASKASYESLFAAVVDPVFIFDMNLRFTEANEAAVAWIGLTRDELHRCGPLDFVLLPPDEMQKHIETLRSQGQVRFSASLRLPSGKVCPTEISGSMFTTPAGRQCVSVVHDVSERTRLDNDLSRANDTLRAIINTLPGYIDVVDTSFKVIEQSPPLSKFVPHPATPVEGHFCYRVNRGAKDICPECVVRVAMAEKRQVSRVALPEEREILGFDAKFYAAPLLDESDEVWGAVEFIMDITDLMDSQRVLAATKARLSMAIEAARLGVWDLDFSTMTNVVNEHWYTMLGYKPDAFPVTFTTWNEMVHPEDQARVLAKFKEHLAFKTPLCQLEYRMRGADGSYRWIMDMCHVYERFPDGNPSRAAGIHLDISERKRLESELLAAKDEAEAANLAKTRFLANVSHELRTPLSAVLGYARLAAAEGVQGPVKDHLHRIVLAAEMLARLVGDILDLSKIEADQLDFRVEPFRPADLLRRVHDLFSASARAKGLELRSGIDPAVPACLMGSVLRLEQVLLNLVSNAIKCTSMGEVSILVDLLPCPDPGWVRVRFLVTDSGLGFDPAILANLFEPFRQAADSLKCTNAGTGLGLSISARLVELMGSRLFASGKPGQGAQFCFTLTMEQTSSTPLPTMPLAPAHTPVNVDDLRGRSVLVVEDNVINREMVIALLQAVGCRTFSAENGLTALSVAQSNLPDAILMDINMPVMDGLEAAGHLKAHPATAHIPLIALTANADVGQGLTIDQAGFTGAIGKPFEAEDLYRALIQARSQAPA